jgi:hypothetical protein
VEVDVDKVKFQERGLLSLHCPGGKVKTEEVVIHTACHFMAGANKDPVPPNSPQQTPILLFVVYEEEERERDSKSWQEETVES